MTCTALALCATLDISGTTITFGPTDHPVAVAEVWMFNQNNNTQFDERNYVMTYEGLTIQIQFDWDRGRHGEDAMIVTPPVGYICEPINCEAVVTESFSGVIYIVPFMGV